MSPTIEYLVWLTYLRRRRRVRNTDSRLFSLQTAHHIVSSSEHIHRSLSPFYRLETETAIHSDNGFATVAFLCIRRVSLDLKTEQSPEIAIPALLDRPYRHVEKDLRARITDADDSLGRAQRLNYPDWALGTQLPVPTSRCMGNWIAIGNVHRESRDTSDMSLDDEIRECFHVLQSRD